MPLTIRQFELGIDEDIENWMRHIYELLEGNRELAYSFEELLQNFLGTSYQSVLREKLNRALDVLVMIGAVDKREVTRTDYYAFRREIDVDSWEPTVPF